MTNRVTLEGILDGPTVGSSREHADAVLSGLLARLGLAGPLHSSELSVHVTGPGSAGIGGFNRLRADLSERGSGSHGHHGIRVEVDWCDTRYPLPVPKLIGVAAGRSLPSIQLFGPGSGRDADDAIDSRFIYGPQLASHLAWRLWVRTCPERGIRAVTTPRLNVVERALAVRWYWKPEVVEELIDAVTDKVDELRDQLKVKVDAKPVSGPSGQEVADNPARFESLLNDLGLDISGRRILRAEDALRLLGWVMLIQSFE